MLANTGIEGFILFFAASSIVGPTGRGPGDGIKNDLFGRSLQYDGQQVIHIE